MITNHVFGLHPNGRDLSVAIPGYSNKHDFATARAAQLDALLSTICGEGFESFDGLNRETKGNLIWLASELAKQVSDALSSVETIP